MNYAYTYTYTPLFSMILPILALLLILAGGIALYTLFVRKPNHYHGAAAKLHDFLKFPARIHRGSAEKSCTA